MKPRALAVAVVAVLCWCAPVFAWNDAGHRTIARVAWDRLTAEQRQKAIDILAKHPRYADFEAAVPAGADKDTHDFVVFAKAAVWPDTIKRRREDAPDDRPHWHYINWPVVFGPLDEKPIEVTGKWDPTTDPQNIVQALQKVTADVKNGAAEDRAKALCWTLHLVGDIHQPLHCSGLYSRNYPKGDRGGNAIRIKGANARELHGVWDSMLTRTTEPEFIAGLAKELTEQYKPDAAELKITDFEKWSIEGKQIAAEVAYDSGKVDHPPADGIYPLDRNYLDRARETARKRAALAGERMAILLSDILK